MTAATTAPTFRPFTRDDWNAFAGAEPFADGAEPLIAEGQFTLAAKRRWAVVLDSTGGCLLVEGDRQSECGGYVLGRPFANPVEATAWFEREVGEPAHLLDLLLAGFHRA